MANVDLEDATVTTPIHNRAKPHATRVRIHAVRSVCGYSQPPDAAATLRFDMNRDIRAPRTCTLPPGRAPPSHTHCVPDSRRCCPQDRVYL
jgi:hypothetical protein